MKKQKIGIVTIVDYDNYGNRLQNYATQEILKRKGYFVKTIKNISSLEPTGFINKLKHAIYPVYKLPTRIKFRERTNHFKTFTKSYIEETDFTVTRSNQNLNKVNEFDAIIIGSDQIWNPNFRKHFFLDLGYGINIPCIASSASFGVSKLGDEDIEFYSNGLKQIKNISVREYEGAEIIKDLINKDAKVVLDPTMMLSVEDWNKVAKPHINKPKSKYIMIYSLGGLSSKTETLLKLINKNKEYEIVHLGNKHIEKYYNSGPSEFIDFIKDAELLITDSFHGIVFSSLYNVPFIIFDREDITGKGSMNSRINTFARHFNTENRKIENVTVSNVFRKNHNEFTKILELKQKEFYNFLDENLNKI